MDGAGPAEPPAVATSAPVVAFKKKKKKETIRVAREAEGAEPTDGAGDDGQGKEEGDGDTADIQYVWPIGGPVWQHSLLSSLLQSLAHYGVPCLAHRVCSLYWLESSPLCQLLS